MSIYLWDEALPELIPEFSWGDLTSEQWTEIATALDDHVSACHEHESYSHPGPSEFVHKSDLEQARKQADEERARLEEQLDAHVRSVKRRRGASEVWVDTLSKDVMYR